MAIAEIELKFPVADALAFSRQLHELDFQLITPPTLESNTLYDTPARILREQKQLLRLRQYGEVWTLTHKAQPPAESDSARYKVRLETETQLADGPAMAEIFAQLGYLPVFRYEKFRTEWADPVSRHHLVMDETPIGTWAELEGGPEWIDATLARLGVDESTCTTESYGRLFLAWKERTGSPVEHLTFSEIQLHSQPA
jgi:adenylate cyclase class 2